MASTEDFGVWKDVAAPAVGPGPGSAAGSPGLIHSSAGHPQEAADILFLCGEWSAAGVSPWPRSSLWVCLSLEITHIAVRFKSLTCTSDLAA